MDRVKFYVEPLRHILSEKQTWLIFRRSLSSCVGIHDTREEAMAAAIVMAEYCVSAGQTAHIHMRNDAAAPWRIVWPEAASGEDVRPAD